MSELSVQPCTTRTIVFLGACYKQNEPRGPHIYTLPRTGARNPDTTGNSNFRQLSEVAKGIGSSGIMDGGCKQSVWIMNIDEIEDRSGPYYLSS